jgi:hypothetical protein
METKKRCPNGTRKNKKNGNCEKKLNNFSRKNNAKKMTELTDTLNMIKFIKPFMKTEMNELNIEVKNLKKEYPEYKKKSLTEDYYKMLIDKRQNNHNRKGDITFFEKIARNENNLEPHCFYRSLDLLATSRLIQQYKDQEGILPRGTAEMLEHIIPIIYDYYQQKTSYILK